MLGFYRGGVVFLMFVFLMLACVGSYAQLGDLYKKPKQVITRWSSFENRGGLKGVGGMENKGAKGHAFDRLAPGESKTLLNVKGSGMITRMWFTVNDRSTETLRSLKLDIFWDDAAMPAVSVPFGDFFGAMIHRPVQFESALFANPEGKSFNCFIPMPFRKSARLVITNEGPEILSLLFYDIDYLLNVKHDRDVLYFHSFWRREAPTKLGDDFEILPRIKGSGRFLGANIGVICNPRNIGWWGEGEVKMYLDGDKSFPTLVGTGTEDYIGTGWGQGEFYHMYQGCLISDNDKGHYMFYRYHVPDPVYFDKDIRVTIQQMGGHGKTSILKMLDENVPITPVSASWANTFVKLLEPDPPIDVRKKDLPSYAWTNYYRRDDVCAVAYFYLDKPENNLPPLAPVEERIASLY